MNRIAIFFSMFLVGCGGYFQGYSTGERVGVPYKLSRKGFVCKTWEGTANLGGIRTETQSGGNQALVPNVWNFTVKDEDSEKFNPTIKAAIENGETVKFTYQQEAIPICNSDDGYFITSVTVIRK